MKIYTEEDLRQAYSQGAKDYCRSSKWIGEFLNSDVDEFLDIVRYNDLKEVEEEIIFSYSFLRRKLGWEEFCDLTGINRYAKAEGYEIKNTDTFQIKESQAVKFGLL